MAPFGTKRAIHAAYIEGLKQTYPWARDGGVDQERGLALAAQAADKALAGKMLGISRATLYRKLKRYNIAVKPESHVDEPQAVSQ